MAAATRTPDDKNIFSRITKELKQIITKIKNTSVQHNVTRLMTTEATDYTLCKATKKLKRLQ